MKSETLVNNDCISTECNNCPDKVIKNKCPLSEKFLLGTDKTSVTPTLVFNFPKARKISEMEYNLFKLSNNSLEYGHTIRNNNHFHYHIYDEVFYKENNTSIENWIDDVKKKYFIDKTYLNYSDTDNVLIIAPKHFSNTVFVNMINERLFANSANILHYDFWKNNIENFQIFYKDAVHRADRIFFVDDTIISGSTFFKSNEFIKHTRNNTYGFDACLFLINRINFYTQIKIWKELDKGIRFFSFANLHLPALKDNGTECHLCDEKDRTEKLFEESFLDRYKDFFYERIQKLTPREISFNNSDTKHETKPFENDKQNLIKVEAIHRVYEYFLTESNKEYFIKNNDFGNWQNDLLKQTKSPFENELMKGRYSDKTITINTAILLKILAFPPFNIYRPIKEKTFKWTNDLLNKQMEKVKNSNYINFEYSDFRDLKYLIRRAGILNSNYLISERFFDFIIELFQNGRLNELKHTAKKGILKNNENKKDIFYEQNKSIIDNIDDFTTYIAAQIKELIYENESRSILLEKRIINLFSKIKENKELRQLFRLLQEENSMIIQRFVEFLNSKLQPEDTYQIALKELKEQNHYQYNTLCDFFEAAKEESPTENERFKKYLDIQHFLSYSEEKSSNSLEEKTYLLGEMIKELVFGEGVNSKETGAFLLIKYKSEDTNNLDKIFLAYKSGYGQPIIESNWNNNNTYITNFINGITNTNGKFLITIEELKKVEDGWVSLYATPDINIKVDFLSQIKDVNYVLLLRFSINEIVKSKQKKESQGVMVFYSNNDVFSITQTRYLLLLKQSISKFIEKHHKNAEYADWVEQKEKLQISENSKKRYENAFLNFNHHIVGKVIYQWQDIENDFNKCSKLADSMIIIGANIINSHFYAELSNKNKITSLLDDSFSNWTNQLLPDYFKEIIISMIKQDLNLKPNFNLSDSLNIEIETFALRTFIVLLLQNIKKHKDKNLNCTSVSIIIEEKYLKIVNEFDNQYNTAYINEFNHKKMLINNYKLDELDGTTFVTIKKYCEERSVFFDFNLDNIKKQFWVLIGNRHKV